MGCAIIGVLFGPGLGIRDCGWSDTGIAWVDENENGVKDSGEKPLAGVRFTADDIQHDYDTSEKAISDARGEAMVSVFPVPCNGFDDVKIMIRAEPPVGYQPTTPSEIQVPYDAVQNFENETFLLALFIKTLEILAHMPPNCD